MFKQISQCFNGNLDKLAMIYCADEKFITRRTFREVKSECEALKQIISCFPNGVVIGVKIGHKPCLLPVIYSLLQHEIAFTLIEIDESIDQLQHFRFHAIITCRAHGKYIQYKEYNVIQRVRTKLGCNYEIACRKSKQIDETTTFKNVCYVIQTSGTMGRKKIVQVTENSIYSNIQAFIELFKIQSSDVIYFGTPLMFDPSILELLLSFATGACLVSTSRSIRNNPVKLLQSLFSSEHAVTFMQMCPSKFLQFSDAQIDYVINETGLRVLALGGEQFPEHILRQKLPCKCKMYNCYGITEMSCWASVEEFVEERDISLGTPLNDTTFYIQENDQNLVQFNKDVKDCLGTLYIESSYRICYVENCQDSRKCTGDVVQVENGRIFYIGRCDDVIKRFGQRVSLTYVEKRVYDSCKLLNSCIFQENLLICFVQCKHVHSTSSKQVADKLRVKLIKELPAHLVPDHIQLIDKLPVKESNGKLNKNSLKLLAEQIIHENNKYLNSREVFKTLWEEYTGCSCSLQSLHNFWELGGNSITAMQFARIYEMKTKSILNRSLFDLHLKSALESLQTVEESAHTMNDHCLKIIWKSNLQACVDSSPTVAMFRNKVVVFIGNFANIFAVFDACTGDEIAKVFLPNVIESAATVVGNHIFVGCFDGKLYNLDLCEMNNEKCELKIAWSYSTGDRIKCTPLLTHHSNIVFGSYDKSIYCLNQNGVLEWKTSVDDVTNSGMKECNEKLYFGCLHGSIICLHSINGSVKWRVKAKHPIFTPPAFKDEEIVIFLDICGNLYSFSTNNDQFLWSYEQNTTSSTKTFSSLCSYKDYIFYGVQDGRIVKFLCDYNKCRLLEPSNIQIIGSLSTTPLCISQKDNDYLIIVSNGGQICLMKIDLVCNHLRLDLVGMLQLPNESFSSPIRCVANEKRFYLGCRDNHIYCIEINR